jgi:hypothetical protein
MTDARRATVRVSSPFGHAPSALILVETSGVLVSDPVLKEVEVFSKLGRPIFPIDIGGAPKTSGTE